MGLNRDLKLLSLSLFLWALGEGLFAFALPIFMTELGASPVQIGQIYFIGSLAMAASLLPAGWASDHFGPKAVLVWGWVAGIFCTVFFAIAHNLAVFMIGWLLYRITAWVIPGISAYTTNARGDLSPERALSTIYSMFHAGLIVSPVVGGYVGQVYGLRVPFWIAGVMFTVSSGVILMLSHQTPHPAASRPRPAELLTNRGFVNFIPLIFFVTVVLYLGFEFAPKFLAEVKHVDLAQLGWLGSLNALGGFTLNQYLGRRPPRRGIIAAIGLVMIHAIVMLQASWVGWFALAYFLRGAVNTVRALLGALVTRLVPPVQLGLAFGISEMVATAGDAVAPYIAGLLYTSAPSLPFVIMLALCPVAAALVWRFAPRQAPLAVPRSVVAD
jgi:MFS family permease